MLAAPTRCMPMAPILHSTAPAFTPRHHMWGPNGDVLIAARADVDLAGSLPHHRLNYPILPTGIPPLRHPTRLPSHDSSVDSQANHTSPPNFGSRLYRSVLAVREEASAGLTAQLALGDHRLETLCGGIAGIAECLENRLFNGQRDVVADHIQQ